MDSSNRKWWDIPLGINTLINTIIFSYGPMNPVNFLEGMWTDPESNAIYGKFETKKDFEDFISRLEGWSKQVSKETYCKTCLKWPLKNRQNKGL